MLLISEDATTHLAIAVLGWAFGGVFTAGGFYIYVRMSIANLERWGQANHEQIKAELKTSHERLDTKIDKNYETLEKKIDRNEIACKGDLSGVGSKVSRIDRDAARRHHNITEVLMLVAPQDKEERVSILLKEEVS